MVVQAVHLAAAMNERGRVARAVPHLWPCSSKLTPLPPPMCHMITVLSKLQGKC